MILSNGMDFNTESPKNIQHLREIVSKFSISARVDNYGWVTVENNIGSSQYLAKSGAELAWLRINSDEIDEGGFLTKFHIVFK